MTEDEASTLCRPQGDECPGEFEEGISVLPDEASLARMDAWIDAHHDCLGVCKVVEKAVIERHSALNKKRRLRWMVVGFIGGLMCMIALGLVVQ